MKVSIIAAIVAAALLTSQTTVRAQDYDDGRGPDPGAAVGAAIVGGVLGGLLGAAVDRRHHHEEKMDRLAHPLGPEAFGKPHKGAGGPGPRAAGGGPRPGGKPHLPQGARAGT